MKDQIIEYLVNKGIDITISKSKDYGVYYDLNTGMKSHCHLVFKGDYIHIHKRYGDVTSIVTSMEDFEFQLDNIINEICWEVKDCLCGRDYMSSYWADLLVELGLLKKHVETVVTYS